MKDNFNEKLKKIMKKRNISQSKLSELTGIRASSISDYYNGKYIPKQDKINLIANALKVDPIWLSPIEFSNTYIDSNSKNVSAIPVIEFNLTDDYVLSNNASLNKNLLSEACAWYNLNLNRQLQKNTIKEIYMDKSLLVDYCFVYTTGSIKDLNIKKNDLILLRKIEKTKNNDIILIIESSRPELARLIENNGIISVKSLQTGKLYPLDSSIKIIGKYIGVISTQSINYG